jgi:hypothetical protein
MKKFFFLLLMINIAVANAQNATFGFEPGDILFQDIDCGSFCDAIEKVTEGVDGKDFSHIALYIFDGQGRPCVIEAVGKGVIYTPIDTFFKRSPKIMVGRVKNQYKPLISNMLVNAQKLLGKPYDDVFDIQNDAFYCSELLYWSFKKANNNQDFFPLFPMTYNDPDTKSIFPIWETYFKDLKIPVPESKPGLNPGGISRDEKIEIVASFY